MKNLVSKLAPIILPLLVLGGMEGYSRYMLKDYDVKLMPDSTNPLVLAIDKNKDGIPDVMVEGWIGGIATGGFMYSREPTEEEIEKYRSQSK